MFRRDLHAQRRVFKRLFRPEGLHQCGRADDRRAVLGLVVIGQEQLLAVEVLCRPLAQFAAQRPNSSTRSCSRADSSARPTQGMPFRLTVNRQSPGTSFVE